jgi:hypothetical protein
VITSSLSSPLLHLLSTLTPFFPFLTVGLLDIAVRTHRRRGEVYEATLRLKEGSRADEKRDSRRLPFDDDRDVGCVPSPFALAEEPEDAAQVIALSYLWHLALTYQWEVRSSPARIPVPLRRTSIGWAFGRLFGIIIIHPP